MTDIETLKEWLEQHGSIHEEEASRNLGINCLPMMIARLRRSGMVIHSQFSTVRNQFGEECRVARYALVRRVAA